MSLATLETAILVELWEVTGNIKLKKKDMLEWSTAPIKEVEGEKVFRCARNGVWVAILANKAASK